MEQPELEREVRDLAQRISAIESRLGLSAEAPRVEFAAAAIPPGAAARDTTDVIPVLGRALLGLAGAFLLRVFTESGSLPVKAGVAIGILYALGWLVSAARTPAERRIGAAINSLTAVIILAPLLWEATLRFHAIATGTAGAILLCFTLSGMAVSWRKNLLIVATIATLGGIGPAAAFIVATHDVLPFTFVLLGIAAAVEASACLDHWLNERWLAALAADLAVLLATWLVTNDRGLPESYAAIPHGWLLAAQAALLAIYLASTIVRTLLRHVTFTAFEVGQCAAAFLISVGGGLRLSPAMAGVLVVCGLACYIVSFAVIERYGHGRNFYTYSTFGILLVLAGSRILLSEATAAAVWSLLAIACMWAGSFTLQIHGGFYLALALAGSGAFQEAATFLLGSAALPGQHPGFLAAGAIAALVCYVRARHSTIFRLAMAAAPAWLLAGIAAGALAAAYHTAFGNHVYCATMRTGVAASASLLLAWAGSRWKRPEISRLIYPAMLLGAYRLVAIDLREDHKAAVVLSLLLYGTALIAVPKISRAAPPGQARASKD